ncbi:hypothetical protein WMY93_031291 [Mugilogobius chulae]|uniref:palmitoyl-protein hydrolase n=1 Tax=Mugilogobius chulae TaxID=88201 RepID=A0AAW0MF08_9GOBI
MAAARKLRLCAVSPTAKHSASVLFLHGSGDTGQGLRAWVRDVTSPDLAFSHIRVIYPTAPERPYTPMRGARSHVWFDRLKISRDCPEHLDSIDSMAETLSAVIQDEVNAGIPKHRIVLGGGGSLQVRSVCPRAASVPRDQRRPGPASVGSGHRDPAPKSRHEEHFPVLPWTLPSAVRPRDGAAARVDLTETASLLILIFTSRPISVARWEMLNYRTRASKLLYFAKNYRTRPNCVLFWPRAICRVNKYLFRQFN